MHARWAAHRAPPLQPLDKECSASLLLHDPCQHAGHVAAAPISGELRDFVHNQIKESVPAQEIIEKNRTRLLDAFMVDHELTDRAAALSAFLDAQAGRDWDLSAQDVANIGTEADKQKRRRDSEPQRSVLVRAQQHKEDVQHVDEQRPKQWHPGLQACAGAPE